MTSRTATWLLRDGALFDGLGGPVRTGHSILMKNGRIASPAADAPSTPVVNHAGGRTVMPDLIKGYVHLANDGSADLAAQVRDDSAATAAYRAAANALTTLDAGITPDGAVHRSSLEVRTGTSDDRRKATR